MQNAVPIMIIFPVLPPFFTPSTWKISSRNGINATNRTDGDTNNPMKVTAANRKHTKYHGPFLAILLVIKDTVHRLTKFVLESGYTSINVKIRNATVVLPNAPENVLEKPNVGIKPSASKVIMLGQSMEIVIHISREPKNTPSTPIASEESPSNSGTNLDPIMIASDRIRKIVSLLLLLFITKPLSPFIFFCFVFLCALMIQSLLTFVKYHNIIKSISFSYITRFI